MDALDLARWQFGITTVYHFLLVPITIGLSGLVALMQTRWYRTGDERYLRMTRFWGTLLLINFALGVATGIVQEFQFGMAWSEYSRFVGDVFGAPLAIEGLAAFFLESTFLGLWIFGWDRLPARIHLGTIWAVFLGTNLSAYFILAANAWMQRPVGSAVNPVSGRAELTSIVDVLTNRTALFAYGHTLTASLATAGAILLGISAWHRARRPDHDAAFFRTSLTWGLRTTLVAALATMVVGHFFGQWMTRVQPMKMAAAEALYESSDRAGLSLLAIGGFEKSPEELAFNIEVPRLLSFMATNSFSGRVQGIDELQAQYEQRYGPGDYVPVLAATYWSFRIMIGTGVLLAALAAAGLWLGRRGREPGRWFARAAIAAIFAPLIANTAGWMFTEMGRQPWIVQGLLRTQDAVSPLPATTLLASLVTFTLLYAALAVIELRLFTRVARRGPDPAPQPVGATADGEALLPALVY
ncbi:cytochrome ubiquinol oxidase subunit I [Paraconexibacter algicola]|uniref:Cytochrome ubiquinol oxidase subunit I n=1 Tax=Paraconexibacter algicola TaxID=2133960 RepID=A0A2T4UDH0_9ACTN|nr:cytochrome ubiquinol oxidase subunit I [Paraconexibacter algicola]PTL55556.1 cytochrome ubiquinol oxidase subunit I [Paraconexibacter algicola]